MPDPVCDAPAADGVPAERPGPGRLWRLLDLGGRVVGVVGALMVLHVAYQLWGTGLVERRAQDELATELERTIEAHRQATAGSAAAGSGAGVEGIDGVGSALPDAVDQPWDLADRGSLGPDGVVAGPLGSVAPIVVPHRDRPEAGAPVARILAPDIGLDKTVVEGVGRPELRTGPGLYPVSPLPGHQGNVAIAGHRTTHGSPFAHLERLEPGDRIVLETVDGVFTYRVEGQRSPDGSRVGHRIVEPEEVEVIDDRGDDRLTLTSCHPRYSDRQRLIVTAVLEGRPVAFAPPEGRSIADRLVAAPAPSGDEVAGPADSASAPSAPAGPVRLDGTAASDGAVTVEGAAATDGAVADPFGWEPAHLAAVGWWLALGLVGLVPVVVLHRRGRRRLALTIAPVLLGYPLVALMASVDALVPSL